jgi:hypothetical protein
MAKPGDVRFDEEGNNKTYEDDDVTNYWLKHYVGGRGCALCDNSGILEVESGRYFCICPNGQAMRWHIKIVPPKKA